MSSLKSIIHKLVKIRPFLWGSIIYNYEAEIIRRLIDEPKDKRNHNKLQFERCKKWFLDKGDELHRLNYPLTKDSIVLDVGGYIGDFASAIYCKYKCKIFVFEPIPQFANNIANKFSKNGDVIVFDSALSKFNSVSSISFEGDKSSLFSKTNQLSIKLMSVTHFFNQHGISKVDLMKLNIEGGEYELLEEIIETGLINSIVNIQVQFHDFNIENAENRMKEIQDNLSKTHRLTYQYEFVWENWELINI